MNIRFAEESDFLQLAEMKWVHCQEDDIDYKEHNLEGVSKDSFILEFVSFLKSSQGYRALVAEEKGRILSAMFVYLIPKLPKPNGKSRYIAYLTNVYTIKEYRNMGIGARLIEFIKEWLFSQKCELIFVWPSDNSVKWYLRNGFTGDNEIFECGLTEE